ncbi:FMN-dependent NADH-azoreductase [Compostimonas suwonensis]|uniref:FMN dependent NADH:quinone oxidoreductase n=1 Tax=Compostimonas suwonensis TaxID=1048394 RepID=A0A2M9BU63_9MICO|nr:NAD(P)H-dependent oxidoreductase [Compostimonas suwonensis]PJJ61484.1 FMN-dependent NADH-azoreductase [Compostimonas suwonensis]
MPTLLHLDSSADLTSSRSRAITATFAEAWRGRGDDYTVVYRDLHMRPLPHLADPALHWAPELRPPGATPAREADELQRQLLDELLCADVLLIGAPLYNYSLPSTLKAWIDYIHVPGVTGSFAGSPRPLEGRPAVIVTARGAVYDPGTPSQDWDHEVPALRIVLGSALGMDVTVVTTSVTLADFVPALAELAERSASELAAAHREAARLGAALG